VLKSVTFEEGSKPKNETLVKFHWQSPHYQGKKELASWFLIQYPKKSHFTDVSTEAQGESRAEPQTRIAWHLGAIAMETGPACLGDVPLVLHLGMAGCCSLGFSYAKTAFLNTAEAFQSVKFPA
jgi:hypothetical protein